MKRKLRISFSLIAGISLFFFFIVFTALVKTVDVAPIAPNGTSIGFSSLNRTVFEAIGTNDTAYAISEVLGILVLVIPFAFARLALLQWIKQKSLRKIDLDLWVLFGSYALTIASYVFFELVVINYRPILVDGLIEASYPSSHTLLAIVIGGTAFLEVKSRIKKVWIKVPLMILASFLIFSIPLLRLLSGVHWLTDIIAASLLGSSLLFLYQGIRMGQKNLKQEKPDAL